MRECLYSVAFSWFAVRPQYVWFLFSTWFVQPVHYPADGHMEPIAYRLTPILKFYQNFWSIFNQTQFAVYLLYPAYPQVECRLQVGPNTFDKSANQRPSILSPQITQSDCGALTFPCDCWQKTRYSDYLFGTIQHAKQAKGVTSLVTQNIHYLRREISIANDSLLTFPTDILVCHRSNTLAYKPSYFNLPHWTLQNSNDSTRGWKVGSL
jgi:hypothetical protein